MEDSFDKNDRKIPLLSVRGSEKICNFFVIKSGIGRCICNKKRGVVKIPAFRATTVKNVS